MEFTFAFGTVQAPVAEYVSGRPELALTDTLKVPPGA